MNLFHGFLYQSHCQRPLGFRIYALLGNDGCNVFEQGIELFFSLFTRNLNLTLVEYLSVRFRKI